MNTPTPKHRSGDVINGLRIMAYCGYSHVHPEEDGDYYTRKHHWYEVRCRCGTVEIQNQQRLAYRTCCQVCSERRRIMHRGNARWEVSGDGVPDFAQLPVPDGLVTGPDRPARRAYKCS